MSTGPRRRFRAVLAAGALTLAATATLITAGPAQAAPDVEITKVADAPSVVAGNTMGFTITVTNSGSPAATAVQITDTLPVGPDIVWEVASSSAGVTCGIALGVLTCDLASLPAGGFAEVHITSDTTTDSCGVYENTASVTWTDTSSSAVSPAAVTPPDESVASVEVTCPSGGGGGGTRGSRINIDSAGGGFGVVPMAKAKAPKFTYKTKGLSPKKFTMPLGEDRTFNNVPAGTYVVSQDKLSGWKLKKIVCEGDPTASWKPEVKKYKVTITLRVPANVFCTFVNAKK